MGIEEVYAIWEDTEFKDKDMKRSFEREISTQTVIELIKKIRNLEQTKVETTTNKRKIVQIVDCPDTATMQGCLMALCDDGTIWYMQNNKWNLIPEQIPQHEIQRG